MPGPCMLPARLNDPNNLHLHLPHRSSSRPLFIPSLHTLPWNPVPVPCSLGAIVHTLEVDFKCPPWGVVRNYGANKPPDRFHPKALSRLEVQERGDPGERCLRALRQRSRRIARYLSLGSSSTARTRLTASLMYSRFTSGEVP